MTQEYIGSLEYENLSESEKDELLLSKTLNINFIHHVDEIVNGLLSDVDKGNKEVLDAEIIMNPDLTYQYILTIKDLVSKTE